MRSIQDMKLRRLSARRGRGRTTAILAAASVLTLPVASTAIAAPPAHVAFDFTDAFVDDDVCAAPPWEFDVFATQHEYGFFNVFFDGDDNFVKVIAHRNIDFVISANGKTLIERDNLIYARGRHPQFFGETFCPALAPYVGYL